MFHVPTEDYKIYKKLFEKNKRRLLLDEKVTFYTKAKILLGGCYLLTVYCLHHHFYILKKTFKKKLFKMSLKK